MQPPAIVIIDLKTDRIIHRFELPESVNPPNAPIASITVDLINNRCDEAFAYMPDLTTFAVVVYRYFEFLHVIAKFNTSDIMVEAKRLNSLLFKISKNIKYFDILKG